MGVIGNGKYPSVDVAAIPSNGPSSSNRDLMAAAFSDSPVKKNSEDYNIDKLIEIANKNLNPKGDVRIDGNFQLINQSLDYRVNIGNDEVPLSSEDDPSRPSTKFTPNLSSPGPGKTDPNQMKEFFMETTDLKPNLDAGQTPGTARAFSNTRKMTVGSFMNLGTSNEGQ